MLDDVFKELDESAAIGTIALTQNNFARLVDFYNTTMTSPELPKATADMTLAEFKALLEKVPMGLQIRMMKEYQAEEQSEPIATRENRRMRFWIIKVFTFAVIGLFLVITGATTMLAFKSGQFKDSPLVELIVHSAVDLLKVIFSLS